MKILIIGFGSMGRRRYHHLEKLSTDPEINIYDSYFDEYFDENLLEQKYDCVFICSPPDTHSKYISKFATKSRNGVEPAKTKVFCEYNYEEYKYKEYNVTFSNTWAFYSELDNIRRFLSDGINFTYRSMFNTMHWREEGKECPSYVSNIGVDYLVQWDNKLLELLFGDLLKHEFKESDLKRNEYESYYGIYENDNHRGSIGYQLYSNDVAVPDERHNIRKLTLISGSLSLDIDIKLDEEAYFKETKDFYKQMLVKT